MFFVNDPGPWQSFVLRGDNVGRPINEVTQKYLHEQVQFENFMSMEQQLQLQQYQNKGPLIENTPSYTITLEVLIENDGERYIFQVGANADDSSATINYGDGAIIEQETIFPSTSFNHIYENAGTYTIGITFSNPENIISFTSDQND